MQMTTKPIGFQNILGACIATTGALTFLFFIGDWLFPAASPEGQAARLRIAGSLGSTFVYSLVAGAIIALLLRNTLRRPYLKAVLLFLPVLLILFVYAFSKQGTTASLAAASPEVTDVVRKAAARHLALPEAQVKMDAACSAQIRPCDSLTFVEIVMDIESTYAIEIPDSVWNSAAGTQDSNQFHTKISLDRIARIVEFSRTRYKLK